MSSRARGGRPSGRELRADVQALRAVAVLSVLLYHLWPNRLPGGFTGVDVFFVISGFLITAHLMTEVERTGRLRVGTFWARRAKRLLPAALLTLAATAVAVWALVPRGLWRQYLDEVVSSTLYVQNWHLARQAVDYLGAANEPSPVQHFWTLSAEEQFYVGLPLLVLASLVAARRLRLRVRPVVLAVVVVVTAASFLHAVALTATSPDLAYFSTFTRAWEFTAGSLLALVAPRALPPVARVLAVTVGLVLVAAATLVVDAGRAFPGPWAAVPVLGTVLAIAAGQGTYLERIGRWRPVAHVGAVSFAVYLWHFPLIVLLPYVTDHALTTVDKLGIAAASLVLATLSTRFVEDPVRFSPRLLGGRPPRVVAAFTVVAMTATAAVALVPRTLGERQADAAVARAAEALADQDRCFGARAMDPGSGPCDPAASDGPVVPEPASRMDDNPNREECWSTGDDAGANVCDVGPADGSRHLLAVGDSHNTALLGAWERIAEERGWRISVASRGWCWWTTADIPEQDGTGPACEGWREDVAQLVADSPGLDAIVVTNRRYPPDEPNPLRRPDVLADGMVEAWAARPSTSVPVIAIEDNPMLTAETVSCLNRTPVERLERCDLRRSEAVDGADSGLREAVERSENAHLVDLTHLFCDATTCPVVIGGVLVYRDASHLTGTYATTLWPYLAEAIDDVLAGAERG